METYPCESLVICSLIDEQEAWQVKAGHKILIIGQGETGNNPFSWNVLSRFYQEKVGNIAVVSSSGTSCTVYDNVRARTAHSQYALQTADLKLVVTRAVQKVKQSLETLDTILWDEQSMSSARIVKISFGGKQVIIVSDFLQLRPMPNLSDTIPFYFIKEFMQLPSVKGLSLPRFLNKMELIRILLVLWQNCNWESALKKMNFSSSLWTDPCQQNVQHAQSTSISGERLLVHSRFSTNNHN